MQYVYAMKCSEPDEISSIFVFKKKSNVSVPNLIMLSNL